MSVLVRPRSAVRIVFFVALGLTIAATVSQSAERSASRPAPKIAREPAAAIVAKHNPPVVTITPRGRLVTTGSVEVDVKFCQPYAPSSAIVSRTFTLNSVDVSGSFSYSTNSQDVACDYYEIWEGTVTLALSPLVQALRVTALDGSNYQGEDEVSYAVPAPWRGVLVSADAGSASVTAGSSGNVAGYTIWNTGDVSATYSLYAYCTGAATPSTCSASTSPLTIAAGASSAASITYTASATPGDTAGVMLVAVDDNEASVTSSGYMGVTVKAAPSPGVVLSRSMETLHRGGCVTVSVASDAAYECGELRLVHALPGVTTMGKGRVPTLIYNSHLARPIGLIQADVTTPCSAPSSVTVSVYANGNGWASGQTTYDGSDWASCGDTRRVIIQSSYSGLSTMNTYQVVATFSGGGGGTSPSAVQKWSLVDRSTSSFGAGWWLAGLERLVIISGSEIQWVGGDGSMTRYVGGGSTFIAVAFDRPDTITYNGGTGEYTREGPANLDVKFNASGLHTSTTNRLGQVTRFTYVSGTDRLDTLIVPVRSGAPLAYKFVYTSSLLDSIIVPKADSARNVKIHRTGAVVDSIRDADGTKVRFGYGGGSNANRIDSRTDRRGNTTHFSYNSVNHLIKDSLSLGGGAFVRHNFRPAESASLTNALPIEESYTSINGARTDVLDETRIWVNQFGQPTRVRDAEGGEATMTYDASWPGLVSLSRSPSRMVSRAFYNSTRAVLDSVMVFQPNGGSTVATTKYTYHSTWPFPVSSTNPIGVIDSMAYDGVGNRTWAQTGGSSRRVTFTYTTDGLDSVVTMPSGVGSPATVLARNALGNVSAVTSPKGYVSFSYQNAIGQDTMTATPHGDTTNAASYGASYYTRVRKLYTRAGRDSVSTTFGPSITLPSPYSPVSADSLRVEHFYDYEGNVTTTRRKFSYSGTWTMDNTSTYDAANRVTYTTTPSSSTTLTLDGAGNVTASMNGRGYTTSMLYDKANRLIRRITPQVTYSSLSCSSLPMTWAYGCSYSFPTIGSSVCIDADTANFSYDHAGRMTRAYNKYGQIERSYYQSGALANDKLRIRPVYEPGDTPCVTAPAETYYGGTEWQAHVYSATHTYDLAGNRTETSNPYAYCGRYGTSTCTTSWNHSGTTGELTSVVDGLGGTTSFGYDVAGRLTSISYPGSITASMTLDALGQTNTRNVTGLIDDALSHDAAGRVKRAYVGLRETATYGSDVDTWYGPLGAVALASGATTAQGGQTTEKFVVDALGNRRSTEAKNMRPSWHPDADGIRNSTISSGGQLTNVVAPGQSSGFYSNKDLSYDASGNVDLVTRTEMDYLSTGTSMWDATRNYYDAGDRLRIVNRAIGPYANDETHPGERNAFEEYLYDALGRRITMRTRRASTCSTGVAECASIVQRTVWDGDQVLMEIRTRGGTGETPANMETNTPVGPATSKYPYGTVIYLHAGSIDQPIAVSRLGLEGVTGAYTVYPHANWRGQYEAGHRPDGTKCYRGSTCFEIAWPGASTTIDGMVGAPASDQIWFGSLISGNTDGSGMSYLRNRYYDPATGRFTQEDPIGLAGGVNAYGFGAGDRINFSDPFGLCPIASGGLQCLLSDLIGGTRSAAADAGRGSSVYAREPSGRRIVVPAAPS